MNQINTEYYPTFIFKRKLLLNVYFNEFTNFITDAGVSSANNVSSGGGGAGESGSTSRHDAVDEYRKSTINDDFNWNMMPKDKFIIGFIPIAWMGRPLYNTRYYRIPRKYINYFIEGLARYIASKEFITSSPDIEHCFYQHNIIKHDEVYCPKRLGVCGLITGTNEFMSE